MAVLMAANVDRRKPVLPRVLTCVVLIVVTVCPSAWPQSKAPSEYQLKAAFLFNFAKFVDWPPGTFATAASPFTICILGRDPFGRDLDDSLRYKTIAYRSIVIRRCQSDSDARTCQILFVSRSESNRIPEIL